MGWREWCIRKDKLITPEGQETSHGQLKCTVLYRLVQLHLETWLARRREDAPDGVPIPRYVERELRAYLKCGMLACGARSPRMLASVPGPDPALPAAYRRRASIHWARLLALLYPPSPGSGREHRFPTSTIARLGPFTGIRSSHDQESVRCPVSKLLRAEIPMSARLAT